MSFHPTAAEHTFLQHTWNSLQYTPHVRPQNKLKKMKILSSITLEPNGKKLEINNNSELAELTTMWKLNNTLLNT